MEFQEVMRQWRRMCKSIQEKNMSCKEDCLLGHNPTCGELEYASLEEINNAETVIMTWAAEHPEPVYPTWLDWLSVEGLVIKAGNGYAFDFTKATEQIPAYIAERQGIPPVGVKP